RAFDRGAARTHHVHDLGHHAARRERAFDGAARGRAIHHEREDVLEADLVAVLARDLGDAQHAVALVAKPRDLYRDVEGAGHPLRRPGPRRRRGAATTRAPP